MSLLAWLGLAWLRAETLNGVQKILPCVYIPGSVLYTIHETSRERPKSAPYPRLKNSKRISNFQVLLNWEHFYEFFFRKKSHNAEKKLKGRTLWSRPVLYVTPETFLVQFLGPPGTFWRIL